MTVWLSLSEVSLNKKKKKKTLQKLCLRHPVIHDRPFQVVAHVVVYFYLKISLVII